MTDVLVGGRSVESAFALGWLASSLRQGAPKCHPHSRAHAFLRWIFNEAILDVKWTLGSPDEPKPLSKLGAASFESCPAECVPLRASSQEHVVILTLWLQAYQQRLLWGVTYVNSTCFGPLGASVRRLLPRPPNVVLLRALLWSLLDGIWGLLKGSWGVLVHVPRKLTSGPMLRPEPVG